MWVKTIYRRYLLACVQMPPSPQKKLGRETLSPIFSEGRGTSVHRQGTYRTSSFRTISSLYPKWGIALDAVIALAIAFLIPLIGSVLSSSIVSGLLTGVGGAVGTASRTSTVGVEGAVKTQFVTKRWWVMEISCEVTSTIYTKDTDPMTLPVYKCLMFPEDNRRSSLVEGWRLNLINLAFQFLQHIKFTV